MMRLAAEEIDMAVTARPDEELVQPVVRATLVSGLQWVRRA
jgi:hypothetical protein